MLFHSGDPFQEGQGLGNFFSGLIRNVIPIAKSILGSSVGKTLKNVALSTAGNIANDIFKGKNIKESAEENLSAAKQKIGTYIKKKFHSESEEEETYTPPAKKIKQKKKKKILGSKKKPFNLLND